MAENRQFGKLVGQLSYPMLIVTACGQDGRAGCLVGFHTQCSIDPSRFLVCISRVNHTSRVAATSEMLGVHFLRAAQDELSALFGEETGDEADKFAACAWKSRDGVPVLTEVETWFTGRVLQRIDLGDHTGYVLVPVSLSLNGDLDQMSSQQVKEMKPGHP